MTYIKKSLDARDKLTILSQDSQYDIACACGDKESDRRHRSKDDKWIYPVAITNRKEQTFLFKTLISNVCTNNCKYCAIRANRDPRRCTLQAEELVDIFFDYYTKGRVMGIFLSSGVIGNAERTMEKLIKMAELLRRREFRGYMHLKVIPGASDAAIEKAVSLANAVSVNIEAAGEPHFQRICPDKDYLNEVIHPMKLISQLTQKGTKFSNVHQTTQFVVGASDETDREIVKYSWGMYTRLNLNRVYYSAYQRGLGESDLPGESSPTSNANILTREHRLYQVDWLIRKYGFSEQEIPFEENGNLSLTSDPKELWAINHPEFFPLDVNRADKTELLRVPGLGLITVEKILKMRRAGVKFRTIEDIGKPNKLLRKAAQYLKIKGDRQLVFF